VVIGAFPEIDPHIGARFSRRARFMHPTAKAHACLGVKAGKTPLS